MAEVAGDHAELKWACLWTVHAVGMWWRVVANRPRPYMAFCINSLGVLLFSGAAYSIFFTLTFPLPAAIAPDVVLALAAFWVMVRTSVNSEQGWRGD
jgi:cytochrome c oxidase assembly factor CtaG